LAEAGYRSVSLFVNYTPAFTEISQNFKENFTSTAPPFTTRSGKLEFVNLGVKCRFLSIIEKSDPHGTCFRIFEKENT